MRIDEIEARAKNARVSLGYRRVLAEPILDDVALLVAFVREVEAWRDDEDHRMPEDVVERLYEIFDRLNGSE